MKKRVIWIIIACVIVGGIFWIFKKGDRDKTYITEEVKSGDISRSVSVTGEVVSKDRADISSKISSTVEDVYVSVGDEVSEGQRIARLNSDILSSQLKEAEEGLRIKEEAEKLARRQWDDYKPEERQSAVTATNQARQAVKTARERVRQSIVRSPIDGTVAFIAVDKGEWVSISSPIATVLRDDLLEIEMDVPESDIAEIEIGQTANLDFDAFDVNNDSNVKAKISQIYPAATVIQDVVYYKTKLEIVGDDSRMKPGMSVDVDVLIDEKKDVLVIPNRAIKTNGDKYVTVLAEDGEEDERMVKIGMKGDNGMTEILSGLSEGEKVVISVSE